jgi:hypothetical protein
LLSGARPPRPDRFIAGVGIAALTTGRGHTMAAMAEPRGGLQSEGLSTTLPTGEPDAKPAPVTLETVGEICPYLLAEGGWRSARAIPGHRCTAVEPPEPLGVGTQRALCLTPLHDSCPVFQTATDRRRQQLVESGIPVELVEQSRVFGAARPVPVALDRPRRVAASARLSALSRSATGAGLAIAAVLALSAVVLARLPGAPDATDSPLSGVAGVKATPTAPPMPTPAPRATPTPTAAAAMATPAPTATPEPSPRTYTVQPGDTLSGIAAQFDTTIAELVRLNDIDDPGSIKIGQVLILP